MSKGTLSSSNSLETIYWGAELYKECYTLEESIINNVRHFFSVDMLELDEGYQEGYERILFAVVSEIGGHRGHFEYLHSTYCVHEYIFGQGTTEDFISVIHEIVNDNLILNDRTDTIRISDAIVSLKREIEYLEKYMSEALTTISGGTQPVSFTRFKPLLKFIDEKNF